MSTDQPRRPYGSGSVKKRADGRGWEVRVSVDGRNVYRTAPTEAEAEKIRRQLVRRKQAGTLTAAPVRTERLDDLLDRWLEHKEAEGLKPGTVDRYRQRLRDFVRPRIGRIRVGELRPIDVSDCLREMARANKRTSTIAATRTALSAALDWATDLELLPRNPAKRVRVPRGQAVEIRTPPDSEHVTAFLTHVRDHRLTPFWHLAAWLGLRRGEILGLTWAAVDLEKATLRVDRQLKWDKAVQDFVLDTTKSTAGARTLPLCGDLPDLFRARRERQRDEREGAPVRLGLDLVFTTPEGRGLHAGPLDRVQRAGIQAAGLPKGAIELHRLRHGVATGLLEMDAPQRIVQAILGHARRSVTDRYQHPTVETLRPWCERLAARFAAEHGTESRSGNGE